VRARPIALAAGGCPVGRFFTMRVRGVIAPILTVVRVAMTIVVHGALMVAERHALPGAHGHRALKRHNERQKRYQNQPGKLCGHVRILPQGVPATSRGLSGSLEHQSRGALRRSTMAITARI